MENNIALLGLGKMGMPIARHLLHRGFHVSAYDPDPAIVAQAESIGLRLAESPEGAVSGSDAVLVLVGFDHQVRELFVTENHIYQQMNENACIFIMSTIHPETSIQVAQRARANQRIAVDATMCRAEHAAVDGTLLLLFGGDPQTLERWKDMLDCFSSDIVRVGDVGHGQIAKTINNVMLWSCVVANQELLLLAESLGVPQRPLIDALLLSSGSNWALETWHKSRPMPWAEDDMTIAEELANSVGVSIPLSSLVNSEMSRIKGIKNLEATLGPGSSMESYVSHVSNKPRGEVSA